MSEKTTDLIKLVGGLAVRHSLPRALPFVGIVGELLRRKGLNPTLPLEELERMLDEAEKRLDKAEQESEEALERARREGR